MGDEQDQVKCGCDEYPECTHVLYWYQGYKAGALEARNKAIEEAAQACEADNTGAFMEANIRRAFADKIRSLAAASKAAGGGQ